MRIAPARDGHERIGFAVHDDHSNWRYHQVSLGYTLGVGTKGDLSAMKD